MKATLSPETMYRVSVNGTDLGLFRVGSDWNNMRELVKVGSMEKLIVCRKEGYALDAIFVMLGGEQPSCVTILGGAPDLLARIEDAAKNKKVEPEPARA